MRQRQRPCQNFLPGGTVLFRNSYYPTKTCFAFKISLAESPQLSALQGRLFGNLLGPLHHQTSPSTTTAWNWLLTETNKQSSVDLKSLGDQKTHSLDCLLLSQLSAEMLTAGPGRRVGAEKNCKAATDKLESILPLQPVASQLPMVIVAHPFKVLSNYLVPLGSPLSSLPLPQSLPLPSAVGYAPGKF